MKILMFTNTFKPHVGGVARSVEAFAQEYRRYGHRVLIVAPIAEGVAEEDEEVLRVPAMQRFNGSDFTVSLPIPAHVMSAIYDYAPDVVHSHHPFLLGNTALRVAATCGVPLVFTHHTMYERYTHYVPGDSPAMQRFAIQLSTEYGNLCDLIFAPSESVAGVLRERGVDTPITVVPTGVDVPRFARGDSRSFRRACGIADDRFVVGHLGRLAPEKNLGFLAESVALFLRERSDAHFLVVGSGPSQDEMRRIFSRMRLADRLHMAGTRTGQELIDAYHAMDVFAFASHTETQGMVLTEAMAAGVPVVALDAPGAREVVRDGSNGRLLVAQRVRPYADALKWIASRDAGQREAIRQAARRTADEFSMPRTAERALVSYRSLIESGSGKRMAIDPAAPNPLETTLRRIETEWELWSGRARAIATALKPDHWTQIPVLGSVIRAGRWARRTFGRDRLASRLLGLSESEGTGDEPGLILIQIDGLARKYFEQALARRRMPFLRRLLAREHYRLHTFYSGQPATTPAVQAELFYGVPAAVPSFSFREHDTGVEVRMFEREAAERVQGRLAAEGRGLLEGGAAYSNIYSGGAAESHFCAATLGWGDLARTLNPIGWAVLVMLYLGSLLRVAALALVETALAISDAVRGLFAGSGFLRELKFISSRVGVAIVLREWITAGACIDAARGVSIIHLNFLAYDEQAHHRGPGALHALWALWDIDRAIRRVWRAAHRSDRRDYRVWIYSDHGQEDTLPYRDLTGRTVQSAVLAVLADGASEALTNGHDETSIQYHRSQWLGGGRMRRALFEQIPRLPSQQDSRQSDGVSVLAMGPIGHVYTPSNLSPDDKETVARRLVEEAQIPIVLWSDGPDSSVAWTSKGRFRLIDDAGAVLGKDHPLLDVVARDLANLCRHPDAGELLICGWRPNDRPISFAYERGAHAGPGTDETQGFLLLPSDAPLSFDDRDYVRPRELRRAALGVLGHAVDRPSQRPTRRAKPESLRVITYNVHSCVGTDGKLAPARIARVIAQSGADIVALQELDVRRARSGQIDQAREIAQALKMEHHFHPAVRVAGEQYGDAVLSRFPMRLIQAGELPGHAGPLGGEPRGAMWVAVEVDGHELQILNTHLGLSPRERQVQVETLVSDQWLGNSQCHDPRLLCGDFNSLPRSPVYCRLSKVLKDAQTATAGPGRLHRTFPSHYPMARIDHVFLSPQLEVVAVEVPVSQLARTASDHLPLIVEIRL